MFLSKLSFLNFRNYKEIKINFENKINIFYGNNGYGKTNLIESIYYLCALKSFRNASPYDIIRHGEESARVYGEIINEDVKKSVEVIILADGKKKVKLNGKELDKFFEYFSNVKVIALTFEDRFIIHGSPEKRRNYLDRAIFTLSSVYLNTIREYNKIVKEKNRLLKDKLQNLEWQRHLDIWNEQLITVGSIIIQARVKFIIELMPYLKESYKEISGKNDEISCFYKMSISPFILENNDDLEKISFNFRKQLEILSNREILVKQATIGPHRDDLDFFINGINVKNFASSGEIKTLILAFKIAEIKLFYNKLGYFPLFIIDDIGSELDKSRTKYLMNYLSTIDIQSFITTTDIKNIPLEDTISYSSFEVGNGFVCKN